ncbi:MAG: mandelate racemase/muconate lactonizing enzyme family protein [Planctomycetota bacterium]
MPTLQRIETLAHGRHCLVRVTDSDGAQGLGQCGHQLVDATVAVLHESLAPVVLGRSVEDLDGLHGAVWRGAYKYLGTFLYRGLAGLDTALWDLRAKRLGVPVRDLLGDGRADELPVYGSCLSRERSPEQQAAFVAEGRERFGGEAFKIKIAQRRGRDVDVSPGRTEAVVRAVRGVLPESVRLMVDANGGYSPERAIGVGRFLVDHGVDHFEEPCPHEEIDQIAEVTRGLRDLPLAVATGEQDYMMPVFRRLTGERMVDVVQCNLGYCGGPTRALQVAAMADAAGLRFMPHSPNTGMVFLFTLQLMASRPAGLIEPVEYNLGRTVGEGLFTPTLVPSAGKVTLPPGPAPGPGFGVEPDPAFLERAQSRVSSA